jgi:hypothetical protein
MSVLTIMSLVSTLAPEAIKLAASLMSLFENKTTEEQSKLLDEIKAVLKPMQLK